jgi:hypothetical protein
MKFAFIAGPLSSEGLLLKSSCPGDPIRIAGGSRADYQITLIPNWICLLVLAVASIAPAPATGLPS